MKSRQINIKIIGMVLLGAMLFLLNLLIGSVNIPLADIFTTFFDSKNADGTVSAIIFQYRLPQAVTASLSGAALAVAGLLMQTLFRNPLADPTILGISSGASLGVALVILLTGNIAGAAVSSLGWWSTIGVSMAAFLGACFVLLLILAISSRLGSMTTLIIAGIMIAYLTGSITDILKFFSQKEDIHAFVIWGMGSFSAVGNSKIAVYAICVILGIIVSYLLSNSLNILLIGELYAQNLGLNLKKINVLIILASGYLTAIVTAYCGPIAFVGLAVPHLARFLFKTSDHRILIPTTMLVGMALTLFCNLVSRLPGFDGNLPINAVTAFIGAPVVLWVISGKEKNK